MKFYVLTLFPEIIYGGMMHSIFGRAVSAGRTALECINIRDFADNKHQQVDDAPYGGGAGMVLMAKPVYDAYQSVRQKTGPGTRVIHLTPHGRTLTQEVVRELSEEKELVFLCGHYEGTDQRVLDAVVTDEISLGDFVLTGGEIPAMAVMDAVSRLLPGVLGKQESWEEESFSSGLLEYPQYTRPAVWEGREVPEVLLSGHHGRIRNWRRAQSLEITLTKRPDLLSRTNLSGEDQKILKEIMGTDLRNSNRS